MEPFAERLLNVLRILSRYGTPVRTKELAKRLAASERTVRWYARRLEAMGMVARLSPKTGWLAA